MKSYFIALWQVQLALAYRKEHIREFTALFFSFFSFSRETDGWIPIGFNTQSTGHDNSWQAGTTPNYSPSRITTVTAATCTSSSALSLLIEAVIWLAARLRSMLSTLALLSTDIRRESISSRLCFWKKWCKRNGEERKKNSKQHTVYRRTRVGWTVMRKSGSDGLWTNTPTLSAGHII